jgi:hypothetical protein
VHRSQTVLVLQPLIVGAIPFAVGSQRLLLRPYEISFEAASCHRNGAGNDLTQIVTHEQDSGGWTPSVSCTGFGFVSFGRNATPEMTAAQGLP